MSDSLVSVIVPVYNRALLIRDSLESVLQQLYQPIEAIVVDDGSTDDSVATVSEWARVHRGDPGFEVRLIQQANHGPSAARNRGLAEARGELVQFLDSDDLIDPRKLALQAPLLCAKPDLDAVVSQTAYLGATGRRGYVTEIDYGSGAETLPELVCLHDIPVHAPLHRRRSLLEVQGFNEALPHSEEVDLHFRLALGGARFSFQPGVLAIVPHHDDAGRVSRRLNRESASFEREFYLRILRFAEGRGSATPGFRAALAARLERIARRYLAHARAATARACLRTAMEVEPKERGWSTRFLYSRVGSWIGAGIFWAGRATTAVDRRLPLVLGDPGRQ